MPDDSKMQNVTLIPDRNPTSSTDRVNIGVRADKSVMLRMWSALPDNTLVENHRTLMTDETVRSFIDTLCSLTGYYSKKQ